MAQLLPLYTGKLLFHLRTYSQDATGPTNGLADGKLGLSKFANWVLCFLPQRVVIFLMFIKSIWIGFVGLTLATASAWAAGPVLQGVVKDTEGRPVKGADIRIEAKDGGKLLRTVKTDANGRYVSGGLPAGSYRITLVVNGAVKTSINNTKLLSTEPTQLNFDLTATSASRALPAAKKGTHWVWMPPFTGSRLPGRWMEVDDNGSWAAAHASAEDVVRVSGEELERTIHSGGRTHVP
jgi:hypothetical protein